MVRPGPAQRFSPIFVRNEKGDTMSDEHYPMLIDGQWVEADGNGRFEVDDPATGETVATVADGGVAEMVRAIDAAHAAFPGWSTTPGKERGAILR